MKSKNLFNRKGLKSFRSSLRNRLTSAKAALWDILKSKNLDGRKFRRQYSIGSYIVDFCCPSEKLIIELDVDPHDEYHKMQEDENRDKYLESLGFTILRFENRLVFQEPEYLKNEIRKVFREEKHNYDRIINHPGRYQFLKFSDKYSAPATPPSKGGETLSNLCIHGTTLRLTAMPHPIPIAIGTLSQGRGT